MRGKPWTKDEDELLSSRFPREGITPELISTLGRSKYSIRGRVCWLGLKMIPEFKQVKWRKVQKIREDSRFYAGYKCISGAYISRLKRHAIERALECTLLDGSDDSFKYLYSIIEKACPLSGFPLIFPSSGTDKSGTASLDRIDSTKGYVKGNVRWVHKNINAMKWNLSDEEFFNLVQTIVKRYS